MAFEFTTTAYGRKIRCEVVDTWQLKEGDALYVNGCFMICGPFEDEVTKYGRKPEYDSKGARWCVATVTAWEKGIIPKGWFKRVEDRLLWPIQGNTRATWARIIDNAPV